MLNRIVGLARVNTLVAVVVCFAALHSSAAVPKISGTVTDLSGKPLPNSTVVVENKATHRRISVQTDEHGRFLVRNLKGSDYSIFVVADSAQDGFRLQLDRNDGVTTREPGTAKSMAHGALLPPASEGH